MAEFAVLCGLSGAGRSTAAAHLEDLGWFVIDNVPAALIPKLGELVFAGGTAFERVALVVRTGDDDVRPTLAALGSAGGRVRMLFLDAATDVLVRRYEDTRRRHPNAQAGGSVADAIERERAGLQDLKEIADVVVDTTMLNVHQLRARIADLFAGEGAAGMQVSVLSFGYKHGLPIDVDIVLDCRFLPNPHWVDELRPFTGLDDSVRDHVLGQPDAAPFLEQVDGLLELLLPAYAREGRTYLSIALGCTGGRHRSVAMAEAVAALIQAHGYAPTVTHRDVGR
ncbi:MAG: RNase adapter RapZ [Acidimicrobiia bacterium]|nr:RNase adapter RapZ [Acidimicrobiia bacterium]